MSVRAAALLDAAMTVQRWQRQFPAWQHYRMTRHIAHRLDCYPTWDAIEDEIARRLLAEGETQRRTA